MFDKLHESLLLRKKRFFDAMTGFSGGRKKQIK